MRNNFTTIVKRILCLVTAFLLLPHAGTAGPRYNDNAVRDSVDPASRISAEDLVLNGRTGSITHWQVFDNAEGRLLIPTAGKTGFTYVYPDGSSTTAWKIKSGTGTLCALVRIGNSHYAAVRVTARRDDWPASRPDEEVYLWIEAYNSRTPVIVPADREPRTTYGEIVSFDTGFPDMTVELLLDGEPVATALSDGKGQVIFDAGHSSDGKDHFASAFHTFGNYDRHAATAFASDPANLLYSVGGTGLEWVANNDCATFQSRILTVAGFPVYAPYADSENNPGGSLTHVLSLLIGDAFRRGEVFTADDFHEGDVIWIRNGRHAMYCSGVNRDEGTLHVYAHSTSIDREFTDDCDIPVGVISAVAQMVTEEIFDYGYRINGVTNPRKIVFDGGAEEMLETLIAGEGTVIVLPECPFDAPAGWTLTGWVLEGELFLPGEEVTVEGHATYTAHWRTYAPEDADIVLPSSAAAVDAHAFEGIPAKSVYIPDGCESLGSYAFGNCENLLWVRVPADCVIDDTAFEGCVGITVAGTPGSPAEEFCDIHEDFLFRPEGTVSPL